MEGLRQQEVVRIIVSPLMMSVCEVPSLLAAREQNREYVDRVCRLSLGDFYSSHHLILTQALRVIGVDINDDALRPLNSEDLQRISSWLAQFPTEIDDNLDYVNTFVRIHKDDMSVIDVDGYIISQISPDDKCSLGYFNCTGLAAIGTCKDTGQQLSLLTHQEKDAHTKRADFFDKLTETFLAFKQRVDLSTVDVAMFGGSLRDEDRSDYFRQVGLFTALSQEILGADMKTLSGPRAGLPNKMGLHVFLHTQMRRIVSFGPGTINLTAPGPQYLPDYQKFYLAKHSIEQP